MAQKAVTSLKPPNVKDNSQNWKPGAPAHSASSSIGWKVSFSGTSTGLNLSRQLSWFLSLTGSWSGLRVFFVAQLLSSERNSQFLSLTPAENAYNLVSFMDFLNYFELLASCLRSFLEDGNVSVSEECVTQKRTDVQINPRTQSKIRHLSPLHLPSTAANNVAGA